MMTWWSSSGAGSEQGEAAAVCVVRVKRMHDVKDLPHVAQRLKQHHQCVVHAPLLPPLCPWVVDGLAWLVLCPP